MKRVCARRLSSLLTLLLLVCAGCEIAVAQYAQYGQYRQYGQYGQYRRRATFHHSSTQAAPASPTSPVPATTEQAAPSPTPESTPTADARPPQEAERLPFTLDEAKGASVEAPSASGLLLRTLGALLLIVGLIVGAGWGLRRFGGARFGAARKEAPELTVLSSVSLGNRRSLAIVRFGERNLLIGTTGEAVTLLATEEVLGGETHAPVPRSVADLLKANEAKEFEEELKAAGVKFDALPQDWHADGGAA